MTTPTAREIRWLALNYDRQGIGFRSWLVGSDKALDIMGRLIEDAAQKKEG